jgi:hypothetical protein
LNLRTGEARWGKAGTPNEADGGNVPTLTLKQIMEMPDQPVSSSTDTLAREFLEIFEPGEPLDREQFEEWIQFSSLNMADVKNAVRRAIGSQWVEDSPQGLQLTKAGESEVGMGG